MRAEAGPAVDFSTARWGIVFQLVAIARVKAYFISPKEASLTNAALARTGFSAIAA